MTATRTAPEPIAGPLFRRACQVPVEGRKRRKLLALVAAHHDAGHDPSVRELARRMGLDWRKVDALLRRLEEDGWLATEQRPRPEPNRYVLRLDRGPR
jgi:DNA-binding MarR family transcriptional regulator